MTMVLDSQPDVSVAGAEEAAADPVTVLFLAARKGDQRALADLIERCEPLVRGVARRQLFRGGDIDDVVQEVWIALIRNLDRIHSPASLRSWLWAVTARFATRQGKARSRLTFLGDRAESITEESAEDAGLGRVAEQENRGRVRHALARLDQAERELLELLFEVDRPSYRSIGAAVQRPVGSIGPTRQRLLSRLRLDPDIRVAV
jgi:RNA polymerase sigma factor (sigma-70 family)